MSGLRLNIGCGRDIMAGFCNVDRVDLPGVDIIADLTKPLPFDDDSVSLIIAKHVLEHFTDPLALMQELHRVAMPDCQMICHVPYGSSDGYRGDWQPEIVTLKTPSTSVQAIHSYRNLVTEMRAELRAVKPIRPMNRELQVTPKIILDSSL